MLILLSAISIHRALLGDVGSGLDRSNTSHPAPKQLVGIKKYLPTCSGNLVKRDIMWTWTKIWTCPPCRTTKTVSTAQVLLSLRATQKEKGSTSSSPPGHTLKSAAHSKVSFGARPEVETQNLDFNAKTPITAAAIKSEMSEWSPDDDLPLSYQQAQLSKEGNTEVGAQYAPLSSGPYIKKMD